MAMEDFLESRKSSGCVHRKKKKNARRGENLALYDMKEKIMLYVLWEPLMEHGLWIIELV
ncbi:hypothetical protein REPUB_Repub05bG0123100 [Reevesia pubescens]